MSGDAVILERVGLDALIAALRRRGRTVIAPTIRDGAIVHDEVASTADLPVDWTEEQEKGTYRLRRRGDGALFGYTVGPQSWKRFLFSPRQRLWSARRTGASFVVDEEPATDPAYAFLGARACEIRAIAIQDKVFLGSGAVDPHYRARRQGLFIVGVDCGHSAPTCFCTSAGGSPAVTEGYDIALAELIEVDRHVFLATPGSAAGAEVLAELPSTPAQPADLAAVRERTRRAAAQQTRRLEPRAREVLLGNPEHPRWDDVAARCLNCANCTMVCPTCFCSAVEDVSDVGGEHAERWRSWDSCFSERHSHVHGGPVRSDTRSRYRQWLTHKLSTWHDQFGSTGCVGCGRCVTWCPVGIDLTEEVAALAPPTPRPAEHP